jgi:pyruvate formate lyase activating enzyme
MTVLARFWSPRDHQRTACELCPVGCVLRPGQTGPCGTRANQGGRMVALRYGQLVAAGLDPIEKKPLYHFLPGAPILSVAGTGCNLHCAFCQNWSISQRHDGPTQELEPAEVVALAVAEGSVGIAYTYSEPLVWWEYVHDTARLAREAGLVNVIVSNGYVNDEPLQRLIPLLDAANIDLKSMDDRFYRNVCKGSLDSVLGTIGALHEAGVHLEVTNLVIPGYNDTDEQIVRLRDHLAGLSADIPLHLSAYHPAWRFDAPATPPALLERAAALCHRRLPYVYTGNVRSQDWSDTHCPACGEVVISRRGYRVECRLREPACPACGQAIPLVLPGQSPSAPPHDGSM